MFLFQPTAQGKKVLHEDFKYIQICVKVRAIRGHSQCKYQADA